MVVWSALIWLALFSLYLVLAGEINAVELSAGLVCALIATVLAIGMTHVAHRHFGFSPPPRALLHPVGALLPEAFSVGVELVRVAVEGARGQRGAFVRQPFDPGGADAFSTGRRALAVIGVSLAPRGFVIRGDTSELMILHTLPPKPTRTDTRWPA